VVSTRRAVDVVTCAERDERCGQSLRVDDKVVILLTGGNGLLGRHLVAALQGRGDEVRVLALPAEDCSWLESRGVAVHRGDIREADTLLAPMRGAEGVFHLAALMGVWRRSEEYHDVNVTGTLNVCRAAMGAEIQRLVHVSSSIVYGLALGHPADEDCPLSPFPDPYPVTKAEGDRLVQRMIADDGLPAVIVRPDQFFGPGDRVHFARLADRLRAGRAIIIGSGENELPLVYVSDVVQGLLLGLDSDGAVGRAYNITDDRRLSQKAFLTSIAREIGADPPRLHIPYRGLYAAGYAGELLARASGGRLRPPTTRFGVAFLGTESKTIIHRAREELGYVPQVALTDGVHRTAQWYLGGTGASPHDSPAPALTNKAHL
jgi:nucleoside-diphosphate-sugar epimerase